MSSNAVLDRLIEQRQEQIGFIDQTLERVETDGRDLVEAETANLDAARSRIRQLSAQIEPLEDFEKLRNAHGDTMRSLGTGHEAPARTRPVGGADRAPEYRTAGEYVVDLIRARGIMDRAAGPDQAAVARIQARALSDQKTSDTPESCRSRSSARSSTSSTRTGRSSRLSAAPKRSAGSRARRSPAPMSPSTHSSVCRRARKRSSQARK